MIPIVLGCALLVSLAAQGRGYVFEWPVVGKALAWVGQRAYSLYLVHYPCFYFIKYSLRTVRPFLPAPYGGLAITAVAYLLAIGIAALTYRWIEAPFQQRGKRIADAVEAGHSPPVEPRVVAGLSEAGAV